MLTPVLVLPKSFFNGNGIFNTLVVLMLLLASKSMLAVENNKFQPILVQSVINEQGDVKGLDNVRNLALMVNSSKLAAVSADDNALSILDFTPNSLLTFNQVVYSKDVQNQLEGAVGLVTANQGRDLFVTSFYSGSLTHFSKNDEGEYELNQIFSDGVDKTRIFVGGERINRNEDKLGLLGVYDVTSIEMKGLLFSVSYSSGTVVSWSADDNGKYSRMQEVNSSQYAHLAGVQAIASDNQSQLAAVSAQTNTVILFEVDHNNQLKHGQVIDMADIGNNERPVTSQFLSPNLLLVANKSAVLMFRKAQGGRFKFIKNLTNQQSRDIGNVNRMTLSPNGKMLALSSETQNVLYFFTRNDTGYWNYHADLKVQLNNGEDVIGTSSVAFMKDGHFLFTSHSEEDAINVYELRK